MPSNSFSNSAVLSLSASAAVLPAISSSAARIWLQRPLGERAGPGGTRRKTILWPVVLAPIHLADRLLRQSKRSRVSLGSTKPLGSLLEALGWTLRFFIYEPRLDT